jgi:hypothetical protein
MFGMPLQIITFPITALAHDTQATFTNRRQGSPCNPSFFEKSLPHWVYAKPNFMPAGLDVM